MVKNASILELKGDFKILQIGDNHTGHHFDIGEFVITCDSFESNEEDKRYVAALGVHKGSNWVSENCASLVDLVSPMPDATFNDFRLALETWIARAGDVKLNTGISALSTTIVRTQKARGLQVLYGLRMLKEALQVVRVPLSGPAPKGRFPVMARPCPIQPRHGFVESRVVKNTKELNGVIEETLKADPKGEVVLMKPIESAYSAIVTDTAVTIGPGTDGATAGKKAFVIPCNSNLRAALESHGSMIHRPTKTRGLVRARALKFAGVRPTDGVFLETVGRTVVQLRTGPTTDFAQTRFSTRPLLKIKLVYQPSKNCDFLVYEARLDEMVKIYGEDRAEVVIYLPFGSLSSHFAVQAISRGLSVVTGHALLEAGQVISFRKEIGSHIVYDPDTRVAIKRARAVATQIVPNRESVAWAVSVIQGLGATNPTIHSLSLLVGAGIVLAKTGTALCFGEHRHYYRMGPGRAGHLARAPVNLPLVPENCAVKNNQDRNQIYSEIYKEPWKEAMTWYTMLAFMHAVKDDFNAESWSGGYGGPKWGQCTHATLEIIQACLPFMLVTDTLPWPTNSGLMGLIRDLQKLIGACNKLITLSHNSSKCLTKVLPSSALSAITLGYSGIHIATHPLTWEILSCNTTTPKGLDATWTDSIS